jgi:hypothetical protein
MFSEGDDRCLFAVGLSVLLMSGCSALDGPTRVLDDASPGVSRHRDATAPVSDGSQRPFHDGPVSDGSQRPFHDGPVSDGSRRSSHDGSDGARAPADASVDAPSDVFDGGSKHGARDASTWEVASDLELLQSGVVHVLGSHKRCSGVVVTHHWVLTAAHCLCDDDVSNPKAVIVRLGGTRFWESPPKEAVIYATFAARIELHPTYDVALIQLETTLPFKVTPLLYDGADGRDLENKVGRAWGFGPHRLNDVGELLGAGETLTSSAQSILGLGEVTTQIERVPNCNGLLPPKMSDGPLTAPVNGRARQVEEAEGGPLFLGDDPETRVLVGVLKGTTTESYAFTGLWAIRDWVRQIAGNVTSRRDCSETIPGSQGMSKPTVAVGSDGQIHVVAVRGDDGTLHHWRRVPDGTISGPSIVPQARSDLQPGMDKEFSAPAGEAPKLGLVFREPETQDLKYVRWSEQTSWSEPLTVPGTRSARAAALSNGVIGFVGDDQRAGAVSYNFGTGFALLPGAPVDDIDINRGFSTHFFGGGFGAVVWNGYRTARNEWTEMAGTFHQSEGGLVWRWTRQVSTLTDWQQAVLTGPPSNGGMIVATRSGGAFSVVEHYLRLSSPTEPARFISIGSNRLRVAGELAAAFGPSDDVWVVTGSVDGEPPGLTLRRSTDCFANDW